MRGSARGQIYSLVMKKRKRNDEAAGEVSGGEGSDEHHPSAFLDKMLAKAATADEEDREEGEQQPVRQGNSELQQWSASKTVTDDADSAIEAAMALWPDRFPSTSSAKKAVRRKMIRVDGELAKCGGLAMKSGQKMQLKERRVQRGTDADAHDSLVLQLAYVDQAVAVCVKPSGIPVDQQRDKANSVMRSMLHQLADTTAEEALRRPAPVHRLDCATSGLVLVARTYPAAR